LPERLIGTDPEYYLTTRFSRFGADPEMFPPEVVAEYLRCFHNPATIHATCEDYGASATIDLLHDEAGLDKKLECPLLALWGAKGFVGQHYEVLKIWQENTLQTVVGQALPCGHYLPEEAPQETFQALLQFFKH
jgi:haloacetate dehalogenase